MGCGAGHAACLEAEQALAFADHAVTPAERAAIEERIDRCASCRQIVAAAARTGTFAHAEAQLDHPVAMQSAALTPHVAAGERIGRYVVERAIGAGGMGLVFLARDPELRRAVVVKLVRPDVRVGDDAGDLEARLLREAQAMAQLSHPNVVQIFDIGRHGDRIFLAMELVSGSTLDAWSIDQKRTNDEILAMYRQAGAGLAAAHRAGLLHRDFKPSNVLVDRAGIAKVTDFGLARTLGSMEAHRAGTAPRATGVHAVLTHHDAIIGTPAYMAPEQLEGAPLDARTDQYAFAVALLDALLDQSAARRSIAPTAPPDAIVAALAKTGVAEHVQQAIVRALASRPDARFPDMASLLGALEPPRRPRRRWPALVAIGALASTGIVGAIVADRSEVATCTAKTPARWTGAPRDRVRAALADDPRPFAAWHADRVVSAIDRAVEDIAATERAACSGTTQDVEASGGERCLVTRRAALDQAIEALPAQRELDWSLVDAIAQCDAATSNAKRRAQQVEARTHEAAITREVASGDFTAATTAALALAALGERTGDDAMRGRALLQLVDLARLRGHHAAAVEHVGQLRAIVDRHGGAPLDHSVLALAEAEAFTELADVIRTFDALRIADEAARAMENGVDAMLRTRTARARALLALRFDAEQARVEIEQALAVAVKATPAVLAAAHAVEGELALARGDGEAAYRAFEAADRHAPARATEPIAIIQRARARATRRDVDGALAELRAIRSSGPTDGARIAIAHAQILHDAGRSAQAQAVLAALFDKLKLSGFSKTPAAALSALEHTKAHLLRCDVDMALDQYRACGTPPSINGVAPKSPLHARVQLQRIREHRARNRSAVPYSIVTLLPMLEAAGAPALMIAELRWELARVDPFASRATEAARLARETFATAGRTAEVAAIDAWLAAR